MDYNAHVVDACIASLLANYDLDYILHSFDPYYNDACGDNFDINVVDIAVDAIRLRNGVVYDYNANGVLVRIS
jgi:hypothetical protein